jgi:O-acetylhomoserine/O-acetylserine sulfhydrylase-like pyridoxal-dependent enzyme
LSGVSRDVAAVRETSRHRWKSIEISAEEQDEIKDKVRQLVREIFTTSVSNPQGGSPDSPAEAPALRE